MVQGLGGKARFVSENYGESALAKRFGVTRYPAIFVDDVLVATPKDFGFYGSAEGAKEGRYAPFVKNAESHERFRADLRRMIELMLAGQRDAARARAAAPESDTLAALPAVTLQDLDGRTLRGDDLRGRVVLVELWATWCPPCRPTLGWLGELAKRYGDDLTVVTIAIESDEAGVRAVRDELKLPFVWVMGTPGLVRAFGDVGGLPTLLIFDREGRSAGTLFGAPPGMHAEAEARLARLLGAR